MKPTNIQRGRKPLPILKIGIDCGALLSGQQPFYSGLTTIAENLISELSKIDKKNKYFLYSLTPFNQSFRNVLNKNMQNIVVKPRWGYKTLGLPIYIRSTKPDVFIALAQAVPPFAPPTLGFIYDLAFIKYPSLYTNPRRLLLNTQTVIEKSKQILTISETSKKDILDHYHLPEGKVNVVYPGLSSIYKPEGAKYIDNKPYFLVVGSLNQTKNIPKLLEAFSKFLLARKNKASLVIISKISNVHKHIYQMIEEYNLISAVKIIGSVDKIDLPKYYRGAVALVNPSIYEGFGLPLAEAMACGVPVIAGNRGAMPEILGSSGIIVDPGNTREMSEAMKLILDNHPYRQKLIKLGLRQVKKFDNRRFAKEVLKSLYKIVNLQLY